VAAIVAKMVRLAILVQMAIVKASTSAMAKATTSAIPMNGNAQQSVSKLLLDWAMDGLTLFPVRRHPCALSGIVMAAPNVIIFRRDASIGATNSLMEDGRSHVKFAMCFLAALNVLSVVALAL
jgi:hypothetical protein